MQQRAAEERARAQQLEQQQYEREQQGIDRANQYFKMNEDSKQAEFDRQAKLAELQGRFAGALGKAQPDIADAKVGEYANAGYMGGQFERAKLDQQEELKRYIQEQIGNRNAFTQQNINQRSTNSLDLKGAIAAGEHDDKFALQAGANAQTDKNNQEAFRRAILYAQSHNDDKTAQLLVQLALGQANTESKNRPGPNDSILAPQNVTDFQNRQTAQDEFWQKMADVVKGRAGKSGGNTVKLPVGLLQGAPANPVKNPEDHSEDDNGLGLK